MKRLLLTLVCCVGVLAATWRPAEALESELEIGSKAPALDIEHWVHDGKGFFQPVTEFESGRVYVVEFWATWCPPCIASIPHLAELQTKYRGEGLQIISISDEPLEEVEAFLERKHPESQKTFNELTSAYCLTTDPDRSSHADFMAASGQNGIPAAFIVGKSGKIEWIGHPMELDEPLDAVIHDTWDREAYKRELKLREEMERLREETMREVSELVNQEKVDEAITLIQSRLDSAPNEEIEATFRDLLNQVKLSTGRLDDEAVAFYRKRLSDAADNPVAVAQFAFTVYGAMRQGVDPGPLVDDSIKALSAVVGEAEDQLKPTLYVVLAQLNAESGNREAAIEAMRGGVEASEGRQKERLQQMLDELQGEASAEPSDS